MAQVKGIALLGLVKFVKKNLKDTNIEGFLQLLDNEEDRKIFQSRLLPTEWYPYRTFVNLLLLMDKQFGRGDLSFAREQGRLSAENDLTGFLRAFLKVGPTKFLMKRALHLWKSYYDTGSLELVDEGDKKISVRFVDFPDIQKVHCRNIEGWIERYLELSGAAGVRIKETRCRTQGDPLCHFEIEYDSL